MNTKIKIIKIKPRIWSYNASLNKMKNQIPAKYTAPIVDILVVKDDLREVIENIMDNSY